MNIKFYSGIKKIKNKFTLIKEKMVKKMKKTKPKFKKHLLTGAVIGITLSLLTACAPKHNNPSNTNNNYNKYTTESEITTNITNDSYYTSTNATVTTEAITATPITLLDADFNNFQTNLNSIDIEFSYEEYFGINEAAALNNDRQHTHSAPESGIIVDGQIDIDALYESVVSQSAQFRSDTGHYMYTVIENKSELMQILQHVVDSINPKIEDSTSEQLGELDCILSDLKVYYGTGVTNASFTDENCLLVNPNMIKMMEIIHENENSFRNVVAHESNHILQSDCPHRENEAYAQTGVSRKDENLAINPFFWLWSIEANAEKQVVNDTGDAPTTYKYLVGYVETMDYVALSNPNSYGYTDIEDSSINRDRNHFYNVLGNGTAITSEEITQLMFAMEVAQSKTDDLKTVVEAQTGQTMTDSEYTTLKKELRAQYCEMLTKIFYNNLSLAIRSNSVTLEDIFTLIKIYEADINYHIEYSKDTTGVNGEFLETYYRIQTEFFTQIALSNNIEYQDLINNFNSHSVLYRDSNNNTYCNATLTWLTEEEKNYVYQRAVSDTVDYTESIYNIVENSNTLSK